MKKITNILATLFVLVSLAALGWAGYHGILYVGKFWSQLDQQVTTQILSLWLLVLVSVIIIAAGVRWARRREARERMNLEKVNLYQQLLAALMAKWRNDHELWDLSVSQVETYERAEQGLLLWGNVAVLDRYMECKQVIAEVDSAEEMVRDVLERLVKAMRSDLGQSTLGLSAGKLGQMVWDPIVPFVQPPSDLAKPRSREHMAVM